MATKEKKRNWRHKIAELINRNHLFTDKLNAHFRECVNAIEKECWTSVNTLPILNWYELRDTGNVTHLMKAVRELTPLELNALNYIYKQIRNDFIRVIGWNDNMKRQIELMQEIARRECDLILKKNDRELSFIKRAKTKLKRLQAAKTEDMTLVELTIMLERCLKVSIDTDKCSVAKFYGYIKTAEKSVEKNGK